MYDKLLFFKKFESIQIFAQSLLIISKSHWAVQVNFDSWQSAIWLYSDI